MSEALDNFYKALFGEERPDITGYEDEPYEAQVLRRLHADHSGQLQEYDDMYNHLEDPTTKSLLADVMGWHVKRMDRIAHHWYSKRIQSLGTTYSKSLGDIGEYDPEHPLYTGPYSPVDDQEDDNDYDDEPEFKYDRKIKSLHSIISNSEETGKRIEDIREKLMHMTKALTPYSPPPEVDNNYKNPSLGHYEKER